VKQAPLYKLLAAAVSARQNCIESGNHLWHRQWNKRVRQMLKLLPHGSGFNVHPSIMFRQWRDGGRLVICASYQHMDDHGGYIGWSSHDIEIVPDLVFNFDLSVVLIEDNTGVEAGTDDMFLDYLCETYGEHLSRVYDVVSDGDGLDVVYKEVK
jgi:hypothetical protein